MSDLELPLFQAKNRLSELLDRVGRGERVFITRRGRRAAVLQAVPSDKEPLERGCLRNSDYWMAEDFDDTPDDLAEYTE